MAQTFTLTLTADQLEIMGYALMSARRDQRQKRADCLITLSDRDGTKARRVAGYDERIARLEAVYSLLPSG